jgi:SAM-dependent methyltransferase
VSLELLPKCRLPIRHCAERIRDRGYVRRLPVVDWRHARTPPSRSKTDATAHEDSRPLRDANRYSWSMPPQPKYDDFGVGYSMVRRPDRRIQQAVDEALVGAARIVNVGAGTGSYEPAGRCVAAIEPSMTMIQQRATGLAPAVQSIAEHLPVADGSADAALAVHTVLHWTDLARGLAEMRRVAATSVILTMDPDVLRELWIIKEYAPEIASTHVASLPSIQTLVSLLPGADVRVVPVPRDCTDGFLAAFWGRPESFLDAEVRRGTSPWHQIPAHATDRAVRQLSDDLADGTWEMRYGHLRSESTYDVGMRLIVAA